MQSLQQVRQGAFGQLSRVLARSLGGSVAKMSTFITEPATLPDLTYDYGALEPFISGDIMELHHSKHHQVRGRRVARREIGGKTGEREREFLCFLSFFLFFLCACALSLSLSLSLCLCVCLLCVQLEKSVFG